MRGVFFAFAALSPDMQVPQEGREDGEMVSQAHPQVPELSSSALEMQRMHMGQLGSKHTILQQAVRLHQGR